MPKQLPKVGLLHDFCVYDFKDKLPKGKYRPTIIQSGRQHQRKAFPDFRQRATGDPVPHVSALSPLPESREAWLISLADKLCAISEFCCFRIALARRHKVVISYS